MLPLLMLKDFKSIGKLNSIIVAFTLVSVILIIGISYNTFTNKTAVSAIPFWELSSTDELSGYIGA